MPDFSLKCTLSEPETTTILQQLTQLGLIVESLENENRDRIFAFLFDFKFKDATKNQEYQKFIDLHHRPRRKIEWTWRLSIKNILWKINQLEED